ncbi:MAG: DKNYY domain-containing protein [Sporocytophaga sp.]|uniref:DKNYY domain-containing protein n=1 Tax=Sporocytophaga sp. TaxID=2231183 RepID=UPI001B212AD6|nr:DKNYY domain-containing protein [Sporocytophaga sp.]MBO9699968.1 DKNYY domain-containing protein [Sporocytophaga sp.]
MRLKLQTQITLLTILISACSQKKTEEDYANIETIRPASKGWFKLSNNKKIKRYFRNGDQVYCGEVQFNDHPMKNVDTASFEVYLGSEYARDKNRVYYPLQIACVDGKNWGVCYCTDYIIKNADPQTFKYLGNEYASDKNSAFYFGNVIKNSDGQSFRIINGSESLRFAVDKNKVYFGDEIFEGADPETFQYDHSNPLNDTIRNFILKDKNHVWKFNPPTQIIVIK